MNKVAIFSDGSRDEYKGKRNVQAAWAIFDRKTGARLNSGHSLDRVKAEKTARGNQRYAMWDINKTHNLDLPPRFERPKTTTPAHLAYKNSEAQKYGFSSWRDAYEKTAAIFAKAEAEYLRIEIVTL